LEVPLFANLPSKPTHILPKEGATSPFSAVFGSDHEVKLYRADTELRWGLPERLIWLHAGELPCNLLNDWT